MRAFSFVHASDLHLGYSQYGLEVRRQDFDDAFAELVDRVLELKPDFMIIAGDLFHQPRPSNITLENTIRNFKRLKDAQIPVLAVDGSHDSAPNIITGTILYPLDSAGLIYYLPRHEGACWYKPGCCYVYGIPNYHTRHKTQEALPKFMMEKPALPIEGVCNIFVLHGAVDVSGVKPPYIEAELTPDMLPSGFCYYAAGHIHERSSVKFKDGFLVYSGCTETAGYDEARYSKGFNYVQVNEMGELQIEQMALNSPRQFVVLDEIDFSGMTPAKIAQIATQMVQEVDIAGAVVIPVLRGTLPMEASRTELDIAQIRAANKKALFVHPVVLLKESVVLDEVVRNIFEDNFKDLSTKSYEYFTQIFGERYSKEDTDQIAKLALTLIEPLVCKQDEKVRQILEELSK
ncbi:MAG: DNA repair exonuclease [Candidatus Bathyarchaeota archaeon]|nr:DNA repair exonuclease [Candidatus Termiticorpusculum sp.]